MLEQLMKIYAASQGLNDSLADEAASYCSGKFFLCVAVPISFCWTTTRREAYCEAIPIKTLRSSGLLQLRKRKCHTSPSLRMTLVLCGTLRPTRIACYLTVFRPVTPSAWLSFSSGKNRTRPFAASRADHLDTVPYDFPSDYPCPEHRLLCGVS